MADPLNSRKAGQVVMGRGALTLLNESLANTPMDKSESSAQPGWQNDQRQGGDDTEATTKLENVNEVDVVTRDKYVIPDPKYLAGASTGYVQGIKDFLSKPIQLAFGNFSSTDTYGTSCCNLPLSINSLFTSNTAAGSAVWGNKVSGFLGIRATIRLHLIVNAQPFQQGRYFLAFNPVYYDSTQSFARVQGSQASLTTSTQLPRAEVDLCTASEVIMDIPYIHINTHMNLLSGEAGWGLVYLLCYIPFATGTGGTQSAPWQIYASLHEVDLVCPTRPITVAQSDPQAGPQKSRYAEYLADKKRVSVKSARLPRQSKAKEETKMTEAPISTFLNKVSTVTMNFSKIPFLSSYAVPLGWCTAVLGGAAAAFGWSKPRNELPVTRMNNVMGQYQQNCDGVENAFSLGLFSTNKVQVMPSLGGTDLDEMSIDFIKQQPAFFMMLGWSTTQTQGTQLANLSTAPFYYQQTVGTSSTGVLLTPLAGLASLFFYYRGSVIFTFKMAKTRFHTGRLLVAFCPGTDSIDASGNRNTTFLSNMTGTNYLHREFVDIQDCCEFEFKVPYVSLQPYNMTQNGYGRLYVYILNPLQCPSTCATTINMAVEVRGADDFEFFQPCPPTYFPSTVAYSQSDPDAAPRKILDLGLASQQDEHIPAQLCVGEKVTSIKQLVSRGFWSDAPTSVASLRPFVMGCLPKQSSVYAPLDYYSFFCGCYAFVRGGMVIRTVSPLNAQWMLQLDIDPSAALSQSYVRDVGMTGSIESDGTKFNSVYVPQYTLSHGRLCGADQGSLSAKPPFRSNLILRKSTLASSSTAPQLYVMRSGADDT